MAEFLARRENAKERLLELGAAITAAANLLRPYAPLIEQFQREAQLMDSVGPILNPTLWKNPERQAVSGLMTPFYAAAMDFIRAYDKQIAVAADALAKVQKSEARP